MNRINSFMILGEIFLKKLGVNSKDKVFEHLISTLKNTITNWDYFVNWSKAIGSTAKLEIGLNILNYLIGKENIEKEALMLLREYPHIMTIIPLLFACRERKFQLLEDYKKGIFLYETYDFNKITPEKAVEFMIKSGFLKQLQSERIKSLVDYVFGVEVGLDTNGRKNRGGTTMESIVEFFIENICSKTGYDYMTQSTSQKIFERWNRIVTVDKSTRRIDFAINTPDKLFLIETNFYAGGGSKLKSTAGEYRTLYKHIKSDGHFFIWITDGAGWNTTKRPLEETFNDIDCILNLDMLEKGLLEEIIKHIRI